MRQGVKRAALVATVLWAAAGPANAGVGDADQPLGRAELAALSGGAARTEVDIDTVQSLSAVNAGNNVVGDSIDSGKIAIHSNAMSGFSGIGNFVINSGHNNNLQGTISVTVVVPEPRP